MADTRQHYWLRDEFESLAEIWESIGFPVLGCDDVVLEYPKTADQAIAELRLRGIAINSLAMDYLLKTEDARTGELRKLIPDRRLAQWNRTQIDALADWYDSIEIWTPTAQLCALLNLSYHQFMKAYLVAQARFTDPKSFASPLDVSRFVLVVEPATNDDDYARVSFHPKGGAIQEIRS